MLASNSELLNQSRCLRISLSSETQINYTQLKYCMKLATSFELYIDKFTEIEVLSLQMIIHKIKKYNMALAKANKQPKKIDTLMIGLNFKINIVLLGEVLSKDGNIFSNLYIKILVAQSSELMPKLFLHFDFVTELLIDLNQKTIDFYEFPSFSVRNIKKLSFKKHSFNFEKLVELYEGIEELYIKADLF